MCGAITSRAGPSAIRWRVPRALGENSSDSGPGRWYRRMSSSLRLKILPAPQRLLPGLAADTESQSCAFHTSAKKYKHSAAFRSTLSHTPRHPPHWGTLVRPVRIAQSHPKQRLVVVDSRYLAPSEPVPCLAPMVRSTASRW